MRDSHEQQAHGAWTEFKGKMKEAWGALTDDDLDRYEGKRDQLIGEYHQKVGEERAEFERRVDALARESKYGW